MDSCQDQMQYDLCQNYTVILLTVFQWFLDTVQYSILEIFLQGFFLSMMDSRKESSVISY